MNCIRATREHELVWWMTDEGSPVFTLYTVLHCPSLRSESKTHTPVPARPVDACCSLEDAPFSPIQLQSFDCKSDQELCVLHAPRSRARVRDRGEEERLHSIFTAQITHVCVLLYHYCHLKLYARIIFIYMYVFVPMLMLFINMQVS